MEPYTLLNSLLESIESNICDDAKIDAFKYNCGFSEVHLRRLFKFAFEKPLEGYIRSRKLAASLESLLKNNARVIDVAAEYGFPYEQSYIRAFKREFGITPGEYRSTRQILEVIPSLNLTSKNRLDGNLLIGPHMVVVPAFHVIGRLHEIDCSVSVEKAPETAKSFWFEDKDHIPNIIEPDVYYGITRKPNGHKEWLYYLPSVKVKDLSYVPENLHGDSFPTSLCARFRYIGRHSYFDLSTERADKMHRAICRFLIEHGMGQSRRDLDVYFERLDISAYDGVYCMLEWYAPLVQNEKVDQKCPSL